ncbi:hypothetical protein H6P81_020757 [Aristolochia fimbriata]|uniref:Uncharacterized protein n=1 Tax=Aristolochia fimbriata TaxID=158543 RepID=A0AAV7DZS4_ARIFI|nr:hypothetical protein H6P81_020757 [Aristolochia fimbriata]
MAMVPDGSSSSTSELGEDRPLCEFIFGVFEQLLEDAMRRMNENGEDGISCVIADLCASAALSVANRMGIPRFGLWCPSAANLAVCLHIPKLIESGVVDGENGEILRSQMIKLSPTMPELSTSDLMWDCMIPTAKRAVFQLLLKASQTAAFLDGILCNSFPGIEATALDLIPEVVPIGPILSTKRKTMGQFWEEDSSCLNWLDQQKHRSVVYVAFGSFTIIDQTQYEELAAGLEQMGRPFLWVVRSDFINQSNVVYPENFLARIANRGKIVSWAPQQKVLSHPAIACFVSHCGWNSVTEGMSNGVPFLCWPYFADQFLNRKYVCEVWQIGIALKENENGIITRDEIEKKVEHILSEEEMKLRALKMKETAEETLAFDGTSFRNFDEFVERIKRV